MVLKFLGIIIDTTWMECRLPSDKLEDLRATVAAWRPKVQLKELQSLLGKLNFVCKIMPMGRIFCRRLAVVTSGVKAPHHFVRLSQDHRADLQVWDSLLEQYNGRSFWLGLAVQPAELDLFTPISVSDGVWAGGRRN